MRLLAALAGVVTLAACSSLPSVPPGGSALTLNNPYWERVNVQLVITKSSDCENRGEYLSSRELVMPKNKLEIIPVPSGANVCWRRDRNPNNPVPGAWSGWTKATLFPGRDAEASL
jgi:hypothetical protein